jgi:hypothetical protein
MLTPTKWTCLPSLAAAKTSVSLSESRYPWTDQAFQDAWQTELDLLAKAVHAETVAGASNLACPFLAQRALRRQEAGLNNAPVECERQREWPEGLARHVELAT